MSSSKSTRGKKRARRRKRAAPIVPNRRDAPATTAPGGTLIGRKPRPAVGELREDAAVFAAASRAELPPELQAEASAVRESLQQVEKGEFDSATAGLKGISRSSPYADWRLFVRGLIAFYRLDTDVARQNWQRLDPARRPSRIASVLLAAETQCAWESQGEPPPAEQVAAVAALRIEREALEVGRRIARVRHRDGDTTFSASQAAMLRELQKTHGQVERELVTRFGQACVYLSTFQPHFDLFLLVRDSVPGPPHDPRWNLLSAWYLNKFTNSEQERDRVLDKYLQKDLQRIGTLSPELLAALTSRVLCMQVEWKQADNPYGSMPYLGTPDFKAIESLLRQAIKHYPANRVAHQRLMANLVEQLGERQLTKAQIAQIEKRIVAAKEDFVAAFPDEVGIILSLIDDYLDQDQLERADQMLSLLDGQRLDDPRARALPWLLKLREAMRLSRRKSNLGQAREALDEAAARWPTWLPDVWLPFLRAAIEKRAGDEDLFQQLDADARRRAATADWVGDVMSFAALQQMRLPSTQLKPLRAKIEDHAHRADSLPLRELCELGAFFWDLTRTGLRHKAYRLQAGKFGKVLIQRLACREPKPDSQTLSPACDWLAEHQLWTNGYSRSIPPWMASLARQHAQVAAAAIAMILRRSYGGYQLASSRWLIERVQQAARTENDPFYRHRFATIGQQAADEVARYSDSDPYSGWYTSPYDDEDDELDDELDDTCMCPHCRARRRAEAAAASESDNGSSRQLDLDFQDDDDDRDEDGGDEDGGDEFDGDNMPFDFEDSQFAASFAELQSKLGTAGVEEVVEIMQQCGQAEPEILSARLGSVFERRGLSRDEAFEFMSGLLRGIEGKEQDNDQAPSEPTPMSPEEKRDLRARRRKARKKQNRKRRR